MMTGWGRLTCAGVLTIRTDDLDFVHQRHHLNIVIDRIKDTLAGKEEVVFDTEG